MLIMKTAYLLLALIFALPIASCTPENDVRMGERAYQELYTPENDLQPNMVLEDSMCVNQCGDGKCAELVCMAEGCPCSESYETCPEDCEKQETAPVLPPTEQELQQACASNVIFSIMSACAKNENTVSLTIKNDGTDIKKMELKLYKDAASSASITLEGVPLVSGYSMKTIDAASSPVKANEVTLLEAIPSIDVRGSEAVCDNMKVSFGDNSYLTPLPSC